MENKLYDVTALGELLIDFTENGNSSQGNPTFEANPGGAPCNVLAMLNRLGKKTAFIGKVGNDMFGKQLKTAVEECGIDTRNLVMDDEIHTTLAFVHTYPDGDRDFSFYRNPGADMMLTKDEVDAELIRNSRIFHFGTLSSTHEGVREATRYALDVAKEANCIITFDPNLRPPLWKDLNDARKEIEYGMERCDVLKISDNEVEFLFDTTDYDKGAALIEEKYHIPLVLITLGKDGSRAYYHGRKVEAAPFLQEHTIETTGAGDTFCASTLNGCVRSLSSGEMLSEVLLANRYLGEKGRVGHIVLMGSGEPLDNYDHTVRFLRAVNEEKGLNLSLRNVSVSTCGLADQIRRLAEENLGITLSLSLHAPNDEIRRQIMPIARRWPLGEVMAAVREYVKKTGRRVVFEYALIDQLNSRPEHAVELAALLRDLQCHVNLIPLNHVDERALRPASPEAVQRFLHTLESRHISATVRREMGSDIGGACGQLRRRELEGTSKE